MHLMSTIKAVWRTAIVVEDTELNAYLFVSHVSVQLR